MNIDIANKTKYKIDKTIIEKAIKAVISNLLPPCHSGRRSQSEISVAIVTPEEIRELNKQYRNKDSVTDCLSFPMNENNILGDIIICYEKLLDQAEQIGTPPQQELAFLTVHSMLHLLGYDHMDKQDEQKMIVKQKEIMHEIF